MISIIVPVYNVEQYIHQCITSILNQTYSDIEVLLIDDGSPDRSGEICEEFAMKDRRIRVFHTENKGLSAARNLGLKEAKGEYIGFVDSDDWIEPDMYGFLLQQIGESKTDISTCELWNEYQNNQQAGNEIKDAVYYGNEAVSAMILMKIHSCVWDKLYLRDCWSNICFPEGQTFEDVATLYKVLLCARAVSCTSKHLYHYRMRYSSVTHNISMRTISDRWRAHYYRYSTLSNLQNLPQKQECIRKMEETLAGMACATLHKACELPREQRDNVLIRNVSRFVRSHTPLLGYRHWGIKKRISFIFIRYNNGFLFAVFHMLKMELSKCRQKERNMARKKCNKGIVPSSKMKLFP